MIRLALASLLLLLPMLLRAAPDRAAAPRAGASGLLQAAVENWLGERDRWAFTQRAVEYDDGVARERLERFDPSQLGNARWRLLAIDGKPPTPEQHRRWAEKKFKRKPRRIDTPFAEFFDFQRARVVEETPAWVRFDVPLRRDKNWLFPVDKVVVNVTLNKETRALERLVAHVREPFKVLLGLARVAGGQIEVDFLNFDPAAPGDERGSPEGVAHVSVYRFGGRVDFTWSDFKRVDPPRPRAGRQDSARRDPLPGAGPLVRTP